MEWVETTGKTLEEAKEHALDQLGVDEQDAEFDVLSRPKSGLFGLLRGEARVRARVKPTRPRPKTDRRQPRRRREGVRSSTAGQQSAGTPVVTDGGSEDETSPGPGEGREATGRQRRRRRRGGRRSTERSSIQDSKDRAVQHRAASAEEGTEMEDASVEDQAEMTRTFLDGLLQAFDLDASISEERVDDDIIELHVQGPDLGLLIGPKGQTLQAIHELSRTVIQRKATGTHSGRVRIDVAGYRQRRKEALARFAHQVAEDVKATGTPKALEPMHPADRKIIHDTINEVAGVHTSSEGEEPRRRVVIAPD